MNSSPTKGAVFLHIYRSTYYVPCVKVHKGFRGALLNMRENLVGLSSLSVYTHKIFINSKKVDLIIYKDIIKTSFHNWRTNKEMRRNILPLLNKKSK